MEVVQSIRNTEDKTLNFEDKIVKTIPIVNKFNITINFLNLRNFFN
jgi:hypothetical protein